ncbi:MAG: CBS domain-containing protein [Anaerolineae bacterium]
MEIILTHDHSDFDAVAAQLGAHKLMPGAVPVISNHVHRNVQHFLSLYWDALPFVQAKELPREPIEHVILVDTQNLLTVRGMNDETSVTIIDHHAARDGLDPAWRVTIDQVGASSTLLVEAIRKARIALTPIEATLLALGIYEDTGSLTYGITTPRDIYAAGWLLEQGMLLDVLNRFLHHSLSEGQKQLYEELVESAEMITVEGYTVVVAAAAAPDLMDEVATLAHKLRDLLEPAATFILVDLGSHIQLVARASVEGIDVAVVARQFGGGGHGRAAAAIIRDKTLQEARAALLEVLPLMATPGITVRDLMSHGVKTLPHHVRARDADRTMRRYGYEGFPVTRNGELIGLVTRRAIDRAMDHGLDGVRVEQLMQAGQVYVRPDDSLATLQRCMMTSGWGQIPVVDDKGAIIGVVTRTDLIKHLGHGELPGTPRAALIALLEESLPPLYPALMRAIGDEAAALGSSLYVVGGFVRDLLLGKPTFDIDFVVEGDAIALTRVVTRAFGGEMRHHARFGTGKWLLNPQVWEGIAARLGVPAYDVFRLPGHIDFATARTEFYDAPSVLPEVEQGNIKLDLHRRDFTINTLALRLDPPHFGDLLDFYNGEEDLRHGVIRVLHSLSFIDDPTRILRAVRFEQRFGFRIEPRTEELIGHALHHIEDLTGDRVRHEIELILAETEPERAFLRLDRLGVLEVIHPALRCDEWTAAAFRALRHAVVQPLWPELAAPGFDTEVPYFALLTYRLTLEEIRAIGRRLRVRRRTIDTLERAQAIRRRMEALANPRLEPRQVDRLLSRADDQVLLVSWAAAPTAQARERIVEYATRLRHIRPTITGEDLIARGLKPGPHFKDILERLRGARLNGVVASDEEERALLERILNELDLPAPGR